MENKEKAFHLIDEFAAKLLVLNDGKKIPTVWWNRLKGQLNKPTPGKPGRKRDYEETRAIAEQLALHRKEVGAEHTKHHSPAKVKNSIAKELKVSRKKLDRIKADQSRLDLLDPEKRKPIIEGMGDALISEVLNDLDAEYRAERDGLLRNCKPSEKNDKTK